MSRHTVTVDADGDYTIECHHPAGDVSDGWVGRPLTSEEATELAAETLTWCFDDTEALIDLLTSSPASIRDAWRDLTKMVGDHDVVDILHDILRDDVKLDIPSSGVTVAESSAGDIVAVVGCVASHGDVTIHGWGAIEPGTYELDIDYDGESVAATGVVGARIVDDVDPTAGADQ